MKTIATAAILMILTTPTWADELQTDDAANTDGPIVLSEAEMDGVTAGYKWEFKPLLVSSWTIGGDADSSDETMTLNFAQVEVWP